MFETVFPWTISGLKSMTSQLADYIIPPRCSLCLQPCRIGFCDKCQVLLPWKVTCCSRCGVTLPAAGICGQCQKQPPPYGETVVAFEYLDPIAHFIHLLKYHSQPVYATTLGTMLAIHAVKNCRVIPDALVPIPLYNRKLRQRGYNQAELVADTVGRLLQIPVDKGLLQRVRNTHSQTSLELTERRKNMHNAFAVIAAGRYDAVAVIDDVITSGATMNAACTALKLNDYKTISAWSIAKT